MASKPSLHELAACVRPSTRRTWRDTLRPRDLVELKRFRDDFHKGKYPGLTIAAAYRDVFCKRHPGVCSKSAFKDWFSCGQGG